MHVVISLAPGGTERLVIEMCRSLAPAVDVTVCCLDEEGAWAHELRDQGIAVAALRRRAGFRPGIGRRIAQIAADRHIDLIHCHQYSPFVYGRIATALSGSLKLVYTEHGRLSDAPPSWKRRLVNPLLARGDGAIVAVSRELREYMVASRFPADAVGVIHNGIHPGSLPDVAARRLARQKLSLPERAFAIFTVARLDPVKDLGTLIDGFQMMRAKVPEARLVVVGDGPEREALMTRARHQRCADAVTFLGMRPDVRDLLPAADVYANTSISEGISVTILEAMAAGVPVVATGVGGTPEILDEHTGVMVPARDAVRCADALVALALAPERRQHLRHAGRGRLETSFSITRMVREYRELYARMLD
jgi:glycosyltransferase involved in cell wall biosynthesis